MYTQINEMMVATFKARGRLDPDLPTPPAPIYKMDAYKHAQTLIGDLIPSVMPFMFKHLWFIAENSSEQPFMTSDAPVVVVGRPDCGEFEGLGLISLGVEIVLPISPRYLLVLLERSYWEPKLRLPDGFVFPFETAEVVARYNRLQMSFCKRQVYCGDDRFEDAVGYLMEHPEECFHPDDLPSWAQPKPSA